MRCFVIDHCMYGFVQPKLYCLLDVSVNYLFIKVTDMLAAVRPLQCNEGQPISRAQWTPWALTNVPCSSDSGEGNFLVRCFTLCVYAIHRAALAEQRKSIIQPLMDKNSIFRIK